MRTRIIFAAVVTLVVAITAMVIPQRDDQRAARVASALPAINEADARRDDSPATTRLPPPDREAAIFAAIRLLTSGSSDIHCVGAVSDAAEAVRSESSDRNPAQATRLASDQLIAELGNLQDDWAHQADLDAYLTAFLLDRPEARVSTDPAALQRLGELGLRAAGSDSPLVAWHALRVCAEAGQSCPFAELEPRLLRTLRANGEAWVLAASIRHQRGDAAGALAAMQSAVKSTTWSWYWPETIDMVERMLAARTTVPYPDRVGVAFDVGATSGSPAQSYLLKMCRTESASSREWGDACLALGTWRAKHSQTEAAGGFAHPMRVDALRALGNFDGAAQAAADDARYQAGRQAGGIELRTAKGQLAQALIESDPAQLREYLGNIRQLGETRGARQFLRQELLPLMERAGVSGRDRECAARLFDSRVDGGARFATGEHPIKAGDELHIRVRSVRGSFYTTRPVGADGMINMPRARPANVAAAGKTSEQLQRDIAMALAAGGDQPPEVQVVVISQLSSEEVRLEFESARRR